MKNLIKVIAQFEEEGIITPLYIVYEDHNYKIDKIRRVEPAASLKSGGIGLRYTCKIGGKDRYLFLEDNQWYIDPL